MGKRSITGTSSKLRALFQAILASGGGGLLGFSCGATPITVPVYMREYPLSRQLTSQEADAPRILAKACAEICGDGATECDVAFRGKETLTATCAQTVSWPPGPPTPPPASSGDPTSSGTPAPEKIAFPPEGLPCPPELAQRKDCHLIPRAQSSDVIAEWRVERPLSQPENMALCKRVCDADATACSITADPQSIASLYCGQMRVMYPSAGRRPPGLCPSTHPNMPVEAGAYLAGAARLEAASVTAFRVLREELRSLRAPKRLLRGASRAAREEIRHAREVGALARRRGHRMESPRIEPRPLRDLESLAIDNAVEGCVRETYGALLATWQSQAAHDRHVRDTMSRIAEDETRHAALSWEIAAWAERRLSPQARARVREAMETALLDLARDVAEQPTSPFAAELGLPTSTEAQILSRELLNRLVSPYKQAVS